MKQLLVGLICLFSLFSFSQKVKEKDGQIFLDEVPVAKVEETAKFEYKFSTLDNSKSLLVLRKSENKGNNQVVNTLIITDIVTDNKAEVPFNPVSMSFNIKKSIAEVLVIRHKLITVNGIENVSTFFGEQSKAKAVEDQKNKEAKALGAKREEELNGRRYFSLASDKVFYLGAVPADLKSRSEEEIKKYFENAAGTYKEYSQPSTSGPGVDLIIDVFDLGEKLLAHAKFSNYSGENNMYVALTGNKNKAFSYNPKYKYVASRNEAFIDELINQCAWYGIDFLTFAEAKVTLERQNTEKNIKYQEALKNSFNIVQANGYAVDEKGEKKNGVLSLEFEKIAKPGSSSSSAMMVDLDGGAVGTTLQLVAKNEKGALRTYTYKAKKDRYFAIVKDDNTEVKYTSLLVKIDKPEAAKEKDSSALDLDSLSGLGNLSLNSASWKYFKEIEFTEKMSIYEDLASQTYVIKVPSQEKGFQILVKKGKEDKFLSKLKDYVGDSVSSSDLEKIDYSNLGGLKNLVDLYSNFK